MARYRVVKGTHQEGKKNYKAGEIIDTSTDLCKAFPNKFENLDAPKPIVEGAKEPKPAVLSPRKVTTPSIPVPPPPGSEKKDSEEAPVGERDVSAKKTSPFGRDVTDRFPQAVKTNVRVFRKGVDYHVTTEEKTDVAISPPLKQEDVDKWCESN